MLFLLNDYFKCGYVEKIKALTDRVSNWPELIFANLAKLHGVNGGGTVLSNAIRYQ